MSIAPAKVRATLKRKARMNEGSAKIYQFPAEGRAAIGGRRYGETKAVTGFAESAVNLADCSGSWYHADAIQESPPGRDH